MTRLRDNDTIAALATPPGEAALGMVRLSGPGALGVGGGFLRLESGIALKELEPRRAALAEARDPAGRPLDRVVVCAWKAPHSYTGEDLLEITCHGSPYILGRLLESAVEGGARLSKAGEFTQRAFTNGKLDLAQAEAVCDLIRSRTEAAHRAAVAQLEGGLSLKTEALKSAILGVAARIEASLDHPDEEVPLLDRAWAVRALTEVDRELGRLLSTYETGRRIKEGARIAIVGSPNVGKSSLLNALLGTDRAITAEEPGTTRDTLEESFVLRGLPCVLVDTAGIRDHSLVGPVERAGMERTRRALKSADLVLWVLDGSRPSNLPDRKVGSEVFASDGGRALVGVINKADLDRHPKALPPGFESSGAVEVSARTGRGLDRLADRLTRELGLTQALDGTLLTSLRHKRSLEDARDSVREALAGVDSGLASELLAEHLRRSLSSLGEMIGETTPEEVLEEIFSRFCIGK